ncbi:MAG: 4Fe-4S dicluster domain-containing protein [candidate division NC10 bacterium]|nr:4Fe-4S dicluster domain-containing protein [candidate division NC10 bacterium]
MATATAVPTGRKSAFDLHDPPEIEKYLDCVHCGFCLPTCPTYLVLGNEMDNPRGRIYLIRAASEGHVGITPSFVKHMYSCLLCRACETACPSSVQFGSLMEAARGQIERHYERPLRERALRRFIFSLFPYPERLRLALAPLRLFQWTGLQALLRGTGLLRAFFPSLAMMDALMPPPGAMPPARPLPEVTPAEGTRRARVGLLSGCIQRVMFGPVNEATVRVLARNGCEVVVPAEQGCCGSLQAHEGELELAKTFARRTIEVFERAGVDHVIVNAAGCGSVMKEYHDLLREDPAWRERAAAFSKKVRDVSQFVAGLDGEARRGEVRLTVTYHDACHLVHGQKVRVEPRTLLQKIPGLKLVELKDSEFCCGSAGLYNLVEPDLSLQYLERKLDRIAETGAEMVVSGNPGCNLQIAMGLRKRNLPVRTAHTVELLDLAYRAAGR